jgi:hypothetical protein
MRRRKLPEKSYYEPVRQFLRKRMGCVVESSNRDGSTRNFVGRGLAGLIVDVFGVRGAKETGSRALEGIAVEVKRSSSRTSLRNLVQAQQYSQLAHRCYLAQPREFDQKTKVEASRLGIGLLQISRNGRAVKAVSESRRFTPDPEKFELFLHKSLRIVRCALCSCYLFRYRPGLRGVAVDGHWVKDQLTSLRNRGVFNKKMYLCPKCEDILREIAGTNKWKKSVEHLERQVERLRARLKRLRSR